MKIYNHELEKFIQFLYELKLMDRKSRMRTRLIRLLADKQAELQQDHLQLVKEYAELDGEGNPIVVEKDGNQVYDIRDQQPFAQAYQRLLLEEVVMEENEERKDMLLSVRDSVLNCGMAFEGEQSLYYDRWCEIVEQIAYE